MIRRCCYLFLAILPLAGTALANIPPLDNSYCTMDPSAEGATLMVLPDGSGPGFDGARDLLGNPVDATITLYVIDEFSVPVYLFPFEDMWLESWAGGLEFCPGGTVADQSTDQEGRTFWSDPLFAGGCALGEGTVVMLNGAPVNATPLPLDFVSPDINGSLVVDLSDIAFFVPALGSDEPCADFNHDGVVNLVDIVLMVGGIGTNCP